MLRTREMVVMSSIAVTALVPEVHAEFIGARVENLGDLGAGVDTFRFYIEFSSPADRLLGIKGTPDHPLQLLSCHGDALRNTNGPFSGSPFEDMPFVGIEAWDSWVTIGSDTFTGPGEVEFTPGFLGGDGTTSVIRGTGFSEMDGGWFDGDPESAETGESILIAQFTILGFQFEGVAEWEASGVTGPTNSFFLAGSQLECTPLPAPGTLALILLPGLFARRRRRGE